MFHNMHNIVRNHGVDISKDPMHPESQDKMKAYTVMHNFRQSLDEGYKHTLQGRIIVINLHGIQPYIILLF